MYIDTHIRFVYVYRYTYSYVDPYTTIIYMQTRETVATLFRVYMSSIDIFFYKCMRTYMYTYIHTYIFARGIPMPPINFTPVSRRGVPESVAACVAVRGSARISTHPQTQFNHTRANARVYAHTDTYTYAYVNACIYTYT